MAASKNSASKSKSAKGRTAPKKKPLFSKKIVTVLTVILIIILIAAIIFISVKGLWGDIIDYVKSMFSDGAESETPPGSSSSTGSETPPGSSSSTESSKPKPPVPFGTAKLDGAILEVRILDIGQGDCILILLPDGMTMVMDIGSEFGSTAPWKVIDGNLKELEIDTIDYLFLTHTDYDHIRDAKKLIDNYQIKNFYFPRADINTTDTWKGVYNAAKAETYIEDGKSKQAAYHENIGAYEISGENWIMKCYSFDENVYPKITEKSSAEWKNAISPTCLLEYADRTVVLTGDSNEKSEEYLMGKGYFDNIDADVLKVGHHGSKSSTGVDFLNKIDCEYAIISCGAKNEYGHPTPEVLKRLDEYTDLVPDDDYDGYAQVYRTDEDGTITVQIDEHGVMNLISEDRESKNTTTGTPYEIESEELSSAVESAVVFVNKRSFYCEFTIAA